MRRPLYAVVLAVVLAIATCAPLAAVDGLAGVWSGTYRYSDEQRRDTTVHFSLIARHAQASALFEGHVQEANAFGNPKDIVLEAAVHGFVAEDGTIDFVKVYDGHGDQTHALWYHGRLSEDRRTVSGKWYADGAWGSALLPHLRRREVRPMVVERDGWARAASGCCVGDGDGAGEELLAEEGACAARRVLDGGAGLSLGVEAEVGAIAGVAAQLIVAAGISWLDEAGAQRRSDPARSGAPAPGVPSASACV